MDPAWRVAHPRSLAGPRRGGSAGDPGVLAPCPVDDRRGHAPVRPPQRPSGRPSLTPTSDGYRLPPAPWRASSPWFGLLQRSLSMLDCAPPIVHRLARWQYGTDDQLRQTSRAAPTLFGDRVPQPRVPNVRTDRSGSLQRVAGISARRQRVPPPCIEGEDTFAGRAARWLYERLTLAKLLAW